MAKPELRSGAVPGGSIPAVIFAHWREVLNRAPVSEAVRGGYALAIGGYLDYCRHHGASVTVESARGYVADAQLMRLSCSHPFLLHRLAELKASAMICSGLYDMVINHSRNLDNLSGVCKL